MQDHDRNISLDYVVDERTHMGKMLNILEIGQNSPTLSTLSTSPKKLIDYRKQRAPVAPIDQAEYLLTPNRHNSSSLRSFDETELPSLAISLEDSLGSYSLTDTQSCLHESANSCCIEKVEFYLKVPKREQTCQRRASLQSLMSQMQLSSNKSDRHHLLLDPKAFAPKKPKMARRASRRLSADDCYRQGAITSFADHTMTINEPTLQKDSSYRGLVDSTEERHQRLKRLSGFCSMRSLIQFHDSSATKIAESGSNSTEKVKRIDAELENDLSRTAQLQKISSLVSMRHLKDDKTCGTGNRYSAWPWKSRDSYPFEIVIPHPDLSRSKSFGEHVRTNKRKKKCRHSLTSGGCPTSSLRRSVSTGEAMNIQRQVSCSPHNLGGLRRWSSSWNGGFEQSNSTADSTASYTEWKIDLMLKTT